MTLDLSGLENLIYRLDNIRDRRAQEPNKNSILQLQQQEATTTPRSARAKGKIGVTGAQSVGPSGRTYTEGKAQ